MYLLDCNGGASGYGEPVELIIAALVIMVGYYIVGVVYELMIGK